MVIYGRSRGMILDTTPTNEKIQEMCRHICNNLNMDDIKPDYIVGLTRGGLIPAVLMSHKLNIPLIPVSYSSPNGNGSTAKYRNEPLQPITNDICHTTVLVVDDIADTGETLNDVCDYYVNLGYTVVTATLYYRTTSKFHPTYVGYVIDAHSPWVVFPWEVNNDDA